MKRKGRWVTVRVNVEWWQLNDGSVQSIPSHYSMEPKKFREIRQVWQPATRRGRGKS